MVIGTSSPGYVAVNNGTFSLANGDATIENLLLTNAAGQMTFASGALHLKNATVANLAALSPRNGRAT
jgi:hypothetical protein